MSFTNNNNNSLRTFHDDIHISPKPSQTCTQTYHHPSSQCSSVTHQEQNTPSISTSDHRMSLSTGSFILSERTIPTLPANPNPFLRQTRAIGKRSKSPSTCTSSSSSVSSPDHLSYPDAALLFAADSDSEYPPELTEFAIRKKAFILSLMDSCSVRGYLTCKLCRHNVWGPNGRYHIEKCKVIRKFRSHNDDNILLHSINGLRIEEEFFAKPKPMKPKPAKIPGFVMSNTVLLTDPTVAPTRAQLKAGAVVGRKGYTRCLDCNAELFAPNTKRHSLSCTRTWKRRRAVQDGSHCGSASAL